MAITVLRITSVLQDAVADDSFSDTVTLGSICMDKQPPS